jgi:DHA1 family bicyclomycin/chloramphenicol resistance-like MFS transporter
VTTLPTSWLILLGTLIAIGPLSIDMYLPAFPAIERGLGAEPGAVEYTLASFFVGLSLGQALYGPISDRYGRRPPLLFGLALYAVASVGCALAPNLAALVVWRFLQALGGCAGMVITRAVVRDRCGAREAARAFSMLILVMGLAPILAPLVGGWIVTHLGWRVIFALLSVFALACLATVYRALPETHDTRHEPPLRLGRVLGDYGRLLTHRAFLGYCLIAGLSSAGLFAYIAGSPFVLIELYGIPPQHFGWVFGINALGFIAASQLNALALKSTPLSRLLRRALRAPALASLALLALALSGTLNLPLALAGFFICVASLGYINPNAFAAALATHGQQAGMASALLGTVQFGLATLAGTLVGSLHDGTARPLVALLASCGVGAWLVHRWLVHPLDRRGHVDH